MLRLEEPTSTQVNLPSWLPDDASDLIEDPVDTINADNSYGSIALDLFFAGLRCSAEIYVQLLVKPVVGSMLSIQSFVILNQEKLRAGSTSNPRSTRS